VIDESRMTKEQQEREEFLRWLQEQQEIYDRRIEVN
jgi:hypothetical protein